MIEAIAGRLCESISGTAWQSATQAQKRVWTGIVLTALTDIAPSAEMISEGGRTLGDLLDRKTPMPLAIIETFSAMMQAEILRGEQHL